jgi:hypothetical protein
LAEGTAIPLARWAGRQLRQLAQETGSARIADLTGQGMLGERAASNGFCVPGDVSAGGGCKLYPAADGWIALNFARPEDRELLPALFGDDSLDRFDDDEVATRIASLPSSQLLEQGRALGMVIASGGERVATPAIQELISGPLREGAPYRPPLVVDLSALWAGPLAAHLLWLAGAEVVKVESASRPDAMRDGDPALFALVNQGKDSVQLDFRSAEGLAALLSLLRRADIVIEAARPRALRQLGVDAEKFIRTKRGLAWITITGHGATCAAAEWVGFGDDCGVAGGLSAALAGVSGTWGFVGDAIADPITGIAAACAAWRSWRDGTSRRIGLSMSGIVALALAEERAHDPALLDAELRDWAAARGHTIANFPVRQPEAKLHALGADTGRWLAAAPC